MNRPPITVLLPAFSLLVLVICGCDATPAKEQAVRSKADSSKAQSTKAEPTKPAQPKPVTTTPTRYQVQTKSIRDRDHVAIHTDAQMTRIDITLHDGIGNATIQRLQGDWPGQLKVRVYSQMLEKFSVETSDGKKAQGSFATSLSPGTGQYQHAWAGDSKIKAKVVPANKLGKALHFDMTLPADLFKANPVWIKIAWIDAYRR